LVVSLALPLVANPAPPRHEEVPADRERALLLPPVESLEIPRFEGPFVAVIAEGVIVFKVRRAGIVLGTC
jgi:hypothetical protein